jgi:hypothetical protein
MNEQPREITFGIFKRPAVLVAVSDDGYGLYETTAPAKARGRVRRSFVCRSPEGRVALWEERKASGFRQTWRYAPKPAPIGRWKYLREEPAR